MSDNSREENTNAVTDEVTGASNASEDVTETAPIAERQAEPTSRAEETAGGSAADVVATPAADNAEESGAAGEADGQSDVGAADNSGGTTVGAGSGRNAPGKFPVGGERTSSFAGKMRAAGYVAGRRYDRIKNEIMRYRNARGARVKSKISSTGEKFVIGRTLLCALGISGNTLKVYLPLDPDAYAESKYHHKDMRGKAKKYERCPMMLRLSSDRQEKNAVSLIEAVAEKFGLTPDPDYIPRDMATVFGKPKRAKRRVIYVRTDEEIPEGATVIDLTSRAADGAHVAPPVTHGGEEPEEDDDEDETAAAEIPGDDLVTVIAPEDANGKLPKRAGVYDGSGDKIGKVRRSVWYDTEGAVVGRFERNGEAVSFCKEEDECGYVDKHDNVLTLAGGYIATLRRTHFYPLFVVLLLIIALAVLSVFFVTCTLTRSDEPYAPVIFIADEEGTSWDEVEDLDVFVNDTFGDATIAPGLDGTYSFIFENRNDNTVRYSLTFTETNEYGIDLAYRLKSDGAYISGHSDYVGAESAGVSDLTVQPHSAKRFELEWKWIGDNDEADTLAGENGATYTLHIEFVAEVAV